MVRETLVWLVLAGLTFVAWLMGNKYDSLDPESYIYMTVAVLMLAFFKVRLVLMHFMEVREAPTVLRVVFDTWLLVTCIAVASIFISMHV